MAEHVSRAGHVEMAGALRREEEVAQVHGTSGQEMEECTHLPGFSALVSMDARSWPCATVIGHGQTWLASRPDRANSQDMVDASPGQKLAAADLHNTCAQDYEAIPQNCVGCMVYTQIHGQATKEAI